MLSWTAERYPERRAIGGPQSLTYREWDALTNQVARVLAARGVRRGDRVVLLLANSRAFAIAHFAVQKLGAMSTPLNPRFGHEELTYCLGDAAADVVVTEDATAHLVEPVLAARPGMQVLHLGAEVPAAAQPLDQLATGESEASLDVRVLPSDPSIMLYTSGTTGRPKGVPRTQHNEASAALAHVVQARYAADEITLGSMPIYHTMGVRSLLAMVMVGGTWVPQPKFDAEQALELIAAERVSSLYLVPTAYWMLLQTGRLAEATTVRKLGYAGAPMSPSVAERLAETLRPEVFVNHYGSTEVYTFTVSSDAVAKPGAAGRPGILSRMRIVVADRDRRARPEDVVAPGGTGELIASLESDEAFAGYWNRPDADAKAIRDGWYFTGDLGRIDEDGDYWVVGRVDDMIITGGENVHPTEVEDVLVTAPFVREVAVVGVPDEKWGQAVTAFVVPAEGSDLEQTIIAVEQWIRQESGLAPHKRPKRIVMVSELPKSGVGKLLRRKLTSGTYQPLADSASSGRGRGSA